MTGLSGLLFFVVFYSINQLEIRFVTQTSQFSLSKSFVVKASSHVGIAKVGGTKITRANDESPFSQEFPAHSDAGEAAVSYTYTWAVDEVQKSGSHFDVLFISCL